MTDKEVLSAMSTMLEPIHNTLEKMNTDLSEVKDRVKRIELTQENIIIPRLNNIEACYTSTYERYKRNSDEFEFALKHDIPIMKQILTEHSRILQTPP